MEMTCRNDLFEWGALYNIHRVETKEARCMLSHYKKGSLSQASAAVSCYGPTLWAPSLGHLFELVPTELYTSIT